LFLGHPLFATCQVVNLGGDKIKYRTRHCQTKRV
jgi:hypothetical protein